MQAQELNHLQINGYKLFLKFRHTSTRILTAAICARDWGWLIILVSNFFDEDVKSDLCDLYLWTFADMKYFIPSRRSNGRLRQIMEIINLRKTAPMSVVVLILLAVCMRTVYAQNRILLFVGTYTEARPDKGIYVFAFDTVTGHLIALNHAENLVNPSFLTLSGRGDFLYACTESKMPGSGNISTFSVDKNNGKLISVNKQNAGGENPVYLSIDQKGKSLINANYTQGNISVFSIEPSGVLSKAIQVIPFSGNSINQARQEKAHPHSVVFSPDQEFVIVPDLGADRIRVFKFDAQAKQPLFGMENLDVKTVAGSGPRHFVFHPFKNVGYCVEELSGTISVYTYLNGRLDSIQRIFACKNYHDTYSGADIHVSPNGLFLYASNRGDGENNIAIFSINQVSGKLSLIDHQSTFGEVPRNFTIDPSGNFLLVANQGSNNIVVFKIDAKTGLLLNTGQRIRVPRPSCLQMKRYGD